MDVKDLKFNPVITEAAQFAEPLIEATLKFDSEIRASSIFLLTLEGQAFFRGETVT